MQAKIFSAYHIDAPRPASERIVASQVGRAINPYMDIDYHDAIENDNISYKNDTYSELTLQYHVWKNELSKLDIVGISHYRRLFNPYGASIMVNNEYTDFEYNKKTRPQTAYDETIWNLVTSENAVDMLVELVQKSKFITLTPFIKTNQWSLWTLAAIGWVPVRTIIEFFEYCQQVMTSQEFNEFDLLINRSNRHFCNNMIMTTSEIFDEYSTWLFDLLFGFEQHLVKVEQQIGQTLIVPRIFGYFSEYMLRPWVFMKGNNLINFDEDIFVHSICFTNLKTDTRI